MTAIEPIFTTLRREQRKALMPFITAGDPDLAFTAAVLKEVISRGDKDAAEIAWLRDERH